MVPSVRTKPPCPSTSNRTVDTDNVNKLLYLFSHVFDSFETDFRSI